MNLERIQNRLKGVIAQLEQEGKKANTRVANAVAECLMDDLTDKERLKFYATASIHCKRNGYGDKLPAQGSRDVDPVLVEAYELITNTITNFVNDGLANNPDALMMQRPKKNTAGNIMHTQTSLTETMIASAQRWYRERLKNNEWNGSVNTMNTITINDSPNQNTEEVQQ